MVSRSGVCHALSVYGIFNLTKLDWVGKLRVWEVTRSRNWLVPVCRWAHPQCSQWPGRRAKAAGWVRSSVVEPLLLQKPVTLFCASLPLCLDLYMESVLEFPLYCGVWKVEIHFIVVSTQLPRGD